MLLQAFRPKLPAGVVSRQSRTWAVANMDNSSANLLDTLKDGFFVPEFEVFVPWLVTKKELFSLIPEREFSISAGGFWPQLRFTLLGFDALFGLNFVTDPNSRLVEVQYCNYHRRKLRRSFRTSARALRKELGVPNLVNISWGQLSWQFESLRIETYLTKHRQTEKERGRDVHCFSVSQFQSKRVG
jgi:hypothetical protein